MRLLTCFLTVLSLSAVAGEEPAPEIDLGEPLLRISDEEAHSQRQTQEQQEESERTFDACLRGFYGSALARFDQDKTPLTESLAESIRNVKLYVSLVPLACERGVQLSQKDAESSAVLAVAFTRKHAWDDVHQVFYSNGNCARVEDPKVFKEQLTAAIKASGLSLELDSHATPDELRDMRAALADLDDEEIDPRKRAFAKLQAFGVKAAPILSLGALSKSPEQRLSCNRLLAGLKQTLHYQAEIADVRAELGLQAIEHPAAPVVLPLPIKISGDAVTVGELELALSGIQRDLPSVYDGLASR